MLVGTVRVGMIESVLVFLSVLSRLGRDCCGVWKFDVVEREGGAICGLV